MMLSCYALVNIKPKDMTFDLIWIQHIPAPLNFAKQINSDVQRGLHI